MPELTDYIVIAWHALPYFYDCEQSVCFDFEALAKAYNQPRADFYFTAIEAVQIKARQEDITAALESCRIYFGLLRGQTIGSVGPVVRNHYFLTEGGINRIKEYITESALANQAGLLNSCKHLEELLVSFREASVTDTVGQLVTEHPDKEVGVKFLIPESPLSEIGVLYISAVEQSKFLKLGGGYESFLLREVSSQIIEPHQKRNRLLDKFEIAVQRCLAPYLAFPPHSTLHRGSLIGTENKEPRSITSATAHGPGTPALVAEPVTDEATEPAKTNPAAFPELPEGFTRIEGPISNDRGETVEMEPETLKQLLDILPYISEVEARKAPAERWSRPDDTKAVHTAREEVIFIKHKEVKYKIVYTYIQINGRKSYRFGVRVFDILKNGREAGTTFFYFTGQC